MGGAATVRGYPEGDYIADSGIRYSFDYFVPLFFVPKDWKLPYSKWPLWKQIQMVFFVDEGYGRLRGPSGLESANRHLFGLGSGLRVRLYKDIFFRTEWAQALGSNPLKDPVRTQFHFRLQAER